MSRSRFNKPNLRGHANGPARLVDLLTLSADQIKRIDIARINLLCATGLPGAEQIDIERSTRTLDLWAKRVESETNRHLYRLHHPQFVKHFAGSEARLRLEMLCQTLQEDFGVRYNPLRIHDPDFSNAKDLFIHGMIADHNGGTCSSMPVLYVAIARRLGYPLRLISAKGHLFCQWRDKRECVNFDGAGNGGCSFFPDDYYRRWPYPITDAEIEAGHYLKPLTAIQEMAAFMAARGHCLEEHPRLDETIQAYEHAVRLDPNNPNYRGFLSLMLRKREASGIAAPQSAAPAKKPVTQWVQVNVATCDVQPMRPPTSLPAFMQPPGFPFPPSNPMPGQSYVPGMMPPKKFPF